MKYLRFLPLISSFLTIIPFNACLAEPPNLSTLKHEIITYHDNGTYEKELTAAIAKAQHYIDQRIAENDKSDEKKKLAIVLDIDETSLSNYQQIAEHDFTGDRQVIHEQIIKAQGQVIKPMLALYHDAIQHGVSVFFVTGRVPSEQQATEENLHKAGYDNWSGLFLRPDNYNQASIIPFKSGIRAQLSQQGYTIIASIGDQYSDIMGGHTEKGFKLPNPFYSLP